MKELPVLLSALDQKRQELSRLEIELANAQRLKLESLSEELGFAGIDELIKALVPLASADLRQRLSPVLSGSDEEKLKRPPGAGSLRKPRAKITQAMRDAISKELQRKKKSAAEVAQAFGVSTSFINQYKRKIGLTQKRSMVD